MISHRERPPERAEQAVGGAQGERTAASTHRVEQVGDSLVFHGRGHRDLRGIEPGETDPQAATRGHDAGHAEAEVVSALVTDDLQRHPRGRDAFERRRAVFLRQLARQRRQESAHGRAEADAGDVDAHGLAVDGGGGVGEGVNHGAHGDGRKGAGRKDAKMGPEIRSGSQEIGWLA